MWDYLGFLASEEECARTAELLRLQLEHLLDYNEQVENLNGRLDSYSAENKSACETEAVDPSAKNVLIASGSEVIALGGCLGSGGSSTAAVIGSSCTYLGAYAATVGLVKAGADYSVGKHHAKCMRGRLATWVGDKEAFIKEYETASYYLKMWLETYQNTYKWLSENCSCDCCEKKD